jgi:hypothetical protein
LLWHLWHSKRERQLIALRQLHGPSALAGQSASELYRAGVAAQDSSLLQDLILDGVGSDEGDCKQRLNKM